MVHDGTFLWAMSYQIYNEYHPRLYKLDPSTHAILDSIDVLTSYMIVCIEMIGNEMWGVCSSQCFPVQMYHINPSTGELIDSTDWCVSPSPYGMAWEGNYLWQAEGYNHQIHKIDLNPNGVQEVFGSTTGINGLS